MRIEMNEKSYVARSSAIAARVIGEETMVMSATNSTLFTLDEVATAIWDAADGATPLGDIVTNKICTQFDVTPEVALQDARILIEQLVEHGLMLQSDQPITKPSAVAKAAP
jgi:Coenzyme PQQ synthesis protein D (PqqD)